MTAHVRTATDHVRLRSIRSEPVPPSVLNRTAADGISRSDAATWAPFFRSLPSVGQVGGTSVVVTWTAVPNCQGQVEYGPTAAYGSVTTPELSFNYATHIQSVTGLTRGTLYHFRVKATGPDGQVTYSPDDTFTTAAGNAIGRTATDGLAASESTAAAKGRVYTSTRTTVGLTSFGGFTIDPTGVVDSSRGINAWVAAGANGTDADHHVLYVLDPAATYRMDVGVCLAFKSYITLWGHKSTSSAWLPSTSYLQGHVALDPGCTISFNPTRHTGHAPAQSGFVIGSGQTGQYSISFTQTCTGVVIRGFNLNGNAATPGIYNGPVESDNGFEVGKAVGVEILYNKLWDIPGDAVRFRGDEGICDSVSFHHNWVVSAGRQGITVVEGDGQSGQYNVFDRVGYYFLDIEPGDDGTFSYRDVDNVTVRYNRVGSMGSSNVGGTFAAVGNGAIPVYNDQHRHMADIVITDNEVSGSTYGLYATGDQHRHLSAKFGQYLTATTVGADPRIQRVTFARNRVIHAVTIAGPQFEAGGIDVLAVIDNDGNIGSGSFANVTPHGGLYPGGCTSVTDSGNV